MSEKNPANVPELPKGYRPMTSSELRLEVPEKEGYHRHWFRGTPERLARAQQAGYRFVDPEDVTAHVNNFDIAGDATASGSTDMGSRVSVISGGADREDDGQPGRMYLMEVENELYEYSQSLLSDTLDGVAEALRGGTIGRGETGETATDMANRYTKGKPSDLFTPKRRA